MPSQVSFFFHFQHSSAEAPKAVNDWHRTHLTNNNYKWHAGWQWDFQFQCLDTTMNVASRWISNLRRHNPGVQHLTLCPYIFHLQWKNQESRTGLRRKPKNIVPTSSDAVLYMSARITRSTVSYGKKTHNKKKDVIGMDIKSSTAIRRQRLCQCISVQCTRW